VVLNHLAAMFEMEKTFTALEVNRKLKSRFEDSTTLRRNHVEDTTLIATFGDEYVKYCASTKRLIPGIW
jgi:hypothetical protein